MKRKNVVVMGGGTGTYTVLSGLKEYPLNLTAIVSMADNGGSTKILREEFGILPPGSVRPALVALSQTPQTLAKLFNIRFEKGSLKDHNFGNLFLTALTQHMGSFEKAIEEASKLLSIEGRVVPSTLSNVHLFARLENGKLVEGETEIDVPKHDGRLRIQKIWLSPKAKANPKALIALKTANLIVVGPGDLYSSIIPNFLVPGIKEAFQKSRAKKVYVCNIMTKFGETAGFRAPDFLKTLEKFVGKDEFDYIVLNSSKPSQARVKKYEKEHAQFVAWDQKDFQKKGIQIIAGNLVRPTGFIRHDPDKLAKVLFSLL